SGDIIPTTDRLTSLHDLQKAADPRIILIDLDANTLKLRQDIGFARLFGHQHLPTVADRLRVDMLVGRWVFHNSGSMDSSLGGECTFANVRRVTIWCTIEPLIERVTNVGEFFKRGRGDSDFKARCKFRLKF